MLLQCILIDLTQRCTQEFIISSLLVATILYKVAEESESTIWCIQKSNTASNHVIINQHFTYFYFIDNTTV